MADVLWKYISVIANSYDEDHHILGFIFMFNNTDYSNTAIQSAQSGQNRQGHTTSGHNTQNHNNQAQNPKDHDGQGTKDTDRAHSGNQKNTNEHSNPDQKSHSDKKP